MIEKLKKVKRRIISSLWGVYFSYEKANQIG